jgi:hypothetical protein
VIGSEVQKARATEAMIASRWWLLRNCAQRIGWPFRGSRGAARQHESDVADYSCVPANGRVIGFTLRFVAISLICPALGVLRPDHALLGESCPEQAVAGSRVLASYEWPIRPKVMAHLSEGACGSRRSATAASTTRANRLADLRTAYGFYSGFFIATMPRKRKRSWLGAHPSPSCTPGTAIECCRGRWPRSSSAERCDHNAVADQ